jgi:hypothetical protein
MLTDLKAEIRAALAGTTSQQPRDTAAVIEHTRRQRGRVEAALLEMYQAQQVYCCKIIKGRDERIVWWIAGSVEKQTDFYGKKNTPSAPKVTKRAIPKMPKAKVSRMSGVSVEVKDLICAQPGLTMPEVYERLNKKAAEEHRVRVAINSLVKLGHIHAEGVKRHYRYYPGEQA